MVNRAQKELDFVSNSGNDKEQKPKEKWYFTFMFRQRLLKNKFVCIEGSFGEARQRLFQEIGARWAFQYSEKEFAGQKEKYNLEEVSINKIKQLDDAGKGDCHNGH